MFCFCAIASAQGWLNQPDDRRNEEEEGLAMTIQLPGVASRSEVKSGRSEQDEVLPTTEHTLNSQTKPCNTQQPWHPLSA